MNEANTRVVNISPDTRITFEKPRMRFSSGFVCCDWCDRQIKAKHLYFVQGQLLNKATKHFAKLCLTCGKEKRGAMYFEGFICKRDKD